MKVVKRTNLVPVREGKRIYGIPISKVAKALKDGATLYEGPFPADVETYEVPMPADDKAPAEPVKAKPAEVKADVEIPEGWEDWHKLSRIKLAKQISGVEKIVPLPGMGPSETADAIIKQEVEARKARKATGKSVPEAEPDSP